MPCDHSDIEHVGVISGHKPGARPKANELFCGEKIRVLGIVGLPWWRSG